MIREHDHEKLMGITSVGERGQVVIPANIREELNLEKGDKLMVFAKHKHFIGMVKTDEMSVFLKRMLSKIEGEDK
jgi:AbrB family looped-hinge helix DNA binding protein